MFRVFNDLKQEHKVRVEEVAETIHSETTVAAVPEANKSDEIIVDGDVPKESQTNIATSSNVVVIDDDSKSSPLEKAKPPQSQEIENTPPKTLLEELITWLHDKSPLTPQQLSNLSVTMEDFERALKCVQPSAKREGFATVPDVTWDDVGSLQDIREELKLAILVSNCTCLLYIYV